jgi:hypothetical protein
LSTIVLRDWLFVMSDTLSGEQMQAKIQAARREADGLKDKIKRKKDELADTSRMLFPALILIPLPMTPRLM